ncbi:MAG TPA: helix-turn-helix domain-containing protein [Candidatus Oscillibacter excrementigallinarum]|uniref:Helix-turn-helix domain-containing protein n=1 Tax=Candidatus Oscillibacter excrementigallinarum TaxID=2838716 RepID=A0A9D2LJB8_9FIRM|nr:helix-turn-helix domain-containing protein [Candidatus Oscillibacter excrementigallinarum]
MDAKATGGLIARRRKERNWSQGDLAERLHVTDKAVSRWETGRGLPSVDLLEPLAEALGLTVSELLSGRELTPEELPKAAGEQIMETMQEKARILKGFAAAVVMIIALAGIFFGYHYLTTAPETDLARLEELAAAYLGRFQDAGEDGFDYNALEIVEMERRGDYLAALCSDGQGNWCMCVFDRDGVFSDRWMANGGKSRMETGKLGSWNFGTSQEAVIIFCGGDLPEEAAYYRFQNSGITYTCPIEGGRVLDVFVLPDTGDISSYPEEVLDQDGDPLDVRYEGDIRPEN